MLAKTSMKMKSMKSDHAHATSNGNQQLGWVNLK